MKVDVFNLEGSASKTVELPSAFSERVRTELIARAVLAENSLRLQPQAHYVLAGMQTTARYYGAMNSWRTGRHMGMAIRPREKLGGGVQGKVKRIPSAVKGKRAHPHKVEKTIIESMNRREYQKAVMSAIAATSSPNLRGAAQRHFPIVLSDDIESLKRTADVVGVLKKLDLASLLDHGREKTLRKGLRRLSRQRLYRKSLLLVVQNDQGIVRAARNIPGVDVCVMKDVSASLLAPGGRPGRFTIWSEGALRGMDEALRSLRADR